MDQLFANEDLSGEAVFNLQAPFKATGDQPEAIKSIVQAFEAGEKRVTLKGVTGSGKTFTMANVIEQFKRPTLVISHNKTLAAQLYAELRTFFPDNAVAYFISYYDYYQPEAYIPQTDTYIEKDSSVNAEIERFRLAASHALLGRRDVIIVASVSCIYGLVSPEDYRGLMIRLTADQEISREALMLQLVEIQYQRNDYQPQPGTFRVRGDMLDVFPSYATDGIRVSFFGDTIESMKELNPTTGRMGQTIPSCLISPAKQFVLPPDRISAGIESIKTELIECLADFDDRGKLLESQRLRQRTEYDLAMLNEMGYCNGIENYSCPLSGREAGTPPPTLCDYFGDDFLCIIDESHVMLPQIRAMYNGDQSRKQMLVDHGFRLPSAKDNRPWTFDEFNERVPRILFTTATPGAFELAESSRIVEQVIRPTGLLDPPIEVRPLTHQIDDVMEVIRETTEANGRTLITTLTKRTAQDLSDYLREAGIKAEYLHSDINAIERVDILADLRRGKFDCLIGINLLREGLDLPEVKTVAVLDADKEGFLRSETALIQTAGRCARNVDSRVIFYANKVTPAIQATINITEARREKQLAYNLEHNITPYTVIREINESLGSVYATNDEDATQAVAETEEGYEDTFKAIQDLEQQMFHAAEALEFERAALLRDELRALRKRLS